MSSAPDERVDRDPLSVEPFSFRRLYVEWLAWLSACLVGFLGVERIATAEISVLGLIAGFVSAILDALILALVASLATFWLKNRAPGAAGTSKRSVFVAFGIGAVVAFSLWSYGNMTGAPLW
jgi:predicted cation transporter